MVSQCGRQVGQGPAEQQVPRGCILEMPQNRTKHARRGLTLAPEPHLRCPHPQACPAIYPAPLSPVRGPHPWGPPFKSEVSSCRFSRFSLGVPAPGLRLCRAASVSGCASPSPAPFRSLSLPPARPPLACACSCSSPRRAPSGRLASAPLWLAASPHLPRAPPALPHCRAAGGALRPRVGRWTPPER